MNRPGIQTVGDFGYRFRSRLEARWANFFTTIGWDWEYEPLDLAGYIPDFIIKPAPIATAKATPILIEVKPATTRDELELAVPKIQQSTWEGSYLVVGTGPKNDWVQGSTIGRIGDTRTDAFHEQYPNADDEPNPVPHMFWIADDQEEGQLIHCPCGTGLNSYMGDYTCRLCGRYDGDNYSPIDHHTLKRYWAQAANDTQWHKT